MALFTTLAIVRQASADTTLYVAYQGLFGTVGILRVDARTLQPISSIDTSVEPSAVAIFNGSLYDVEGNTVYLRNPTTGAILAQNAGLSGIAGMCIVDGSPVVLTNASAPGPNGTTIYTPSYSRLDGSTLAVQASHELYNVTGNSTYTGRLAYPSIQNPFSVESPFIVASAGNGLTQTVDLNLIFSGVALQTTLGPNVAATFGTVGPTAGGDGYTWSGFSSSLGTGVFASDASLNPLIQYGFTTPAAIGGIAFQNAILYYSAFNVLYRHDPLTDQTLAQSAALPDIFGSVAVDVDPLIQGDVNLDGHVDASDVSAMEVALADPTDYLHTYSLTADDLLTLGDVNDDGQFNNADLQALIDLLLSGQGTSTAVPEPSTIALLTLGGIGLVLGRRRRA